MTAPHGRALIDTNVLVYAFDASEPDKRKIADALIADVDPDQVALSAQVLNEFYVTVTRKPPPPPAADRAERVVHWLAGPAVVPVGTELVIAGIGRSRASQLSLWDSLVVEAARRAVNPFVAVSP
ncbi:MAG: PIN domain-containing protein [Jiangellaceae bacterium]